MLEVEVKYRAADWGPVRAALGAWGAVADPPREDADHYFNAPDRDFRATDESLRLRRIGQAIYLTYKGPRRDTETRTRPEVELPIATGPDAAADAVRLLTGLGYRPVAVVVKTRLVYRFRKDGYDFQACLDDVGAVGKFVELEIMAEESEYEPAKAALLATAAALGLREADKESRSYLRMLLGD